MSWIQCLLSYGYQEGVGLGEEPDLTDDDTHLIPQLIDRVVLSKIIGKDFLNTTLTFNYCRLYTVCVGPLV